MNLQDILDLAASMAGCDAPAADSTVYVESRGDVSRVLLGVDTTLAEVMWAQQNGFDAVIAHHPLGGSARTRFPEVVQRQVAQMTAEGVEEDAARAAVAARLESVHRSVHMANVDALVDAARLVGMPLCNVHLACDILGREAIVAVLRERAHGGASVADAISWLTDGFSEYRGSHARPEAWVGSTESRLGRWTVAMAGGTNGGFPVFREYFSAGVDTIFAMHIGEADLQQLRAVATETQTLVVTGHMPTDSIGINLLIAALEERGVEVVRTSGVVAPAP